MEEFVIKEECKLSEFLKKKYPFIGYSVIQKLIRKKEIKVNNKRVAEDVLLKMNDVVCVYTANIYSSKIEIVYQDDNIIIVNKPAGIEVCDSENSLEKLLFLQYKLKVFAVHRLDMNTKGLIMLAKTQNAKNELEKAFKNHDLNKLYLVQVFGAPKNQEKLVAYLKKNSDESYVQISNTAKPGYVKILTNYKLIKSENGISTLEVDLLTGKTHQIRAHLAHIGLPVVGDDKYGDKEKNKKYKKHRQQLVAYKLEFVSLGGELSYLNGKSFQIDVKF